MTEIRNFFPIQMVQSLCRGEGVVHQPDNSPIHTERLMTEWFDEHES